MLCDLAPIALGPLLTSQPVRNPSILITLRTPKNHTSVTDCNGNTCALFEKQPGVWGTYFENSARWAARASSVSENHDSAISRTRSSAFCISACLASRSAAVASARTYIGG